MLLPDGGEEEEGGEGRACTTTKGEEEEEKKNVAAAAAAAAVVRTRGRGRGRLGRLLVGGRAWESAILHSQKRSDSPVQGKKGWRRRRECSVNTNGCGGLWWWDGGRGSLETTAGGDVLGRCLVASAACEKRSEIKCALTT